ncbi:DUPLICATED HOMEODOMAIN-LIKE SUPERFAMILY PROTEIN [Salix purpurea]|uniref:DUPLICATED HOMEODOMAIN-LIKE SUPERFAMILY PROTEIN n=1 Tax=Salix purpurea TaxID=77065 RepID=A0A9Q0PE34_SALPP|nr:DUPLICATED HOMEODOMAIN-LIKE SUPERFAMILY PROTEIN [Salix purpurea]
MENQLGASKSPLSPPKPKHKRIRLGPPPSPPSKISIEGPHLPMIADNIPCPRGTIKPMRRPNGNGKDKNTDLDMRREMENDEKIIRQGVKELVQEYYKKNPGEAWTDQEHEQLLMGLRKYGAGNYGKISRKFVKTKNLQQVKNHANLVFQISGQLLRFSTRKGPNTKVGIAKPNPAAAANVVHAVPCVADAASGTNGVVEPETNANVVDQIIGTTSRTRPFDLFPASPPKPTITTFPVTAPTFPARSETGSSNVPPGYTYDRNLQDMLTHGSAIDGDLSPSSGELDLDLNLGSWWN